MDLEQMVKGRQMQAASEVIAVLGLGYVGLPLALAFGETYTTIGFDVNENHVTSCQNGEDPAGLLVAADFEVAQKVTFVSDVARIADATVFVVAVPTPVTTANIPDFEALKLSAEMIAHHLKPGDIVIIESTVYPGATEEILLPILQKGSGLKQFHDFNVGYSPERINPGDRHHKLRDIVKVVSGDCPESLDRVARLYESIIDAGLYRAESIMVAEAAKVIENVQRDVNIALINELSLIFDRAKIDTNDVLNAAASKWNFLNFRPGLVGGHCIGVDPFYLTYKSEMLGYHAGVILAARRINDNMAKFVAQSTVKELASANRFQSGAKILILGATFKENVSDMRNSKVVDLCRELKEYGCDVFVYDPEADLAAIESHIGTSNTLTEIPSNDGFEAVIVAVLHDAFQALSPEDLVSILVPNGLVMDLKGFFDRNKLRQLGLGVWRL